MRHRCQIASRVDLRSLASPALQYQARDEDRLQQQHGGRGRITVNFDKSTHHLDLMAGERTENATLDRFGFFNLQAGGHHVEVYIDDLTYSQKP